MPFAEYSDFAACIAANQDKDDPDAYCGSIQAQAEKHMGLTLTRDEVKKICPACAVKMEARGWTHLNVSAETLQKLGRTLDTEADKPQDQKPDNRFTIKKIEPDKQLVFGWANVAIRKDGTVVVDHDQDMVTPEVLEEAAYGFVALSGEADDMHEGPAIGRVVESVVFTAAKKRAMGIAAETVPDGWWVGFHIEDPDVFAKVKTGERRMLSIAGVAQREMSA